MLNRVNMYRVLFISVVFACFVMSCDRHCNLLEHALSIAGENRSELENVLEYYQDSALKLKAAQFLVTNMIGISIPDTISLIAYQPLYQECDSIKIRYKNTEKMRWESLVDSLWNMYQKNIPEQVKYTPLLKTITAKQLITEIELAFKSWKENELSKDCSFEDFCEYILPFSRGNCFVLDDSRSSFYQLYKGKFYRNNMKSIFAETDSLLYIYKDIDFDIFGGANIPILSTKALMQMGGGLCTERGTFNSLLLSALGAPVTMDFVPHWGNRNSSHSWNVLIVKGKCYAFDPFWYSGNSIYNRLYGNTGAYDPNGYGEFRTPKIYRKTYSNHFESTLLNKGISQEDIPLLFRNFKKKDVSTEYFEAADVEVELTQIPPDGAKYAYLCVFDVKGWVPVQFGKIEHRKAKFQDMGKNIVYLPAYYKNGIVLPAAMPFWLKENGEIQLLDAPKNDRDSIVIRNIAPDAWVNAPFLNCMIGANIIGKSQSDSEDTLCHITDILPIRRTTYSMDTDSRYRFLRLNLPSDTIALGELSFYANQKKIPDVKITSTLQSMEKDCEPELLFNEFAFIGYLGKAPQRVVDIDLGGEYSVTSVVVAPYVVSHMFPNSYYELFYWENAWKSLEVQKGGKRDLIFRNVPRNALLRLKQTTEVDFKLDERIFIYKDGEVIWM